MNHKQNKSFNDSDILFLINKSLDFLKIGQLEEAVELFLEILKKNYANTLAEFGIKCCKYWMPRLNKANAINEGYQRGKLLYDEWKKFEKFIGSLRNINQKVVSHLLFFVYNKALEAFKTDIDENKIIDIQIYFLIALSYKKIGDFKNAIVYFEETLNNDPYNSNAMAQLADCYALIDEEKKAKVLFREAFFIDPSFIEIDDLDSNIIHTLISRIKELKIKSKFINHWLPVYGRILSIFNVKRELLPVELGKLKQEIFSLEQKVNNDASDNEFFKAKLINCHFWLYDYYLIKKAKKDILNEIENKINFLSNDVYNLFKNNEEQEKK